MMYHLWVTDAQPTGAAPGSVVEPKPESQPGGSRVIYTPMPFATG